jgi:hypothetical protein
MDKQPQKINISKTSQDNKELVEQDDLFGIEITELIPASTNTAHLHSFAIGSDGLEYAVKTVDDGTLSTIKVKYPKLIPATEWLCYKIAEKVGIATPVCRILKNGVTNEYVFGSRIELSANTNPLKITGWLKILENSEQNLVNQLWSIHVFDKFIYNVDRHINNYLYTQNSKGVVVFAFDFSLASFVFGWPSPDTKNLPSDSKTMLAWNYIYKNTKDDKKPDALKSALRVLNMLRALNQNHIKNIIEEMPDAWLHPTLTENLLKWWISDDRIKLIDSIEKEICNGSN